MELKPGYKQTVVGVIPEEWVTTSLCELVDQSRKITYGIVVPGPSVYDGVPLIRAQDYSKGWVDLEDLYRVSHALDKAYKRSKVITGDVLLTIVGSVGNIAKVPHAFDGSNITQQTARLSFNAAVADTDYYLNVLQSDVGKTAIANFTKSGVQPSLNLSDVEKFMLPRPPLPEQRAIAAALSDVDGLLGGLDRLIAKKRDLKQAAMQQLLTGQSRLPGFDGEWEGTTLGALVTFLSGGTPSRSNKDYWMGDIPWISATSLRCFEIWRSDSNVTKAAVSAGSKMAPVGSSLLLVRGSALHNEILCGLVTKPVCFNQDVKALVPHSQILPKFLTLFIRGIAEDFLKLVSSAGNTAGVLDTKLLKAFPINLPKLSEQTAIAEVLTEMDAELAALAQRREKTRALKQAMMQELLTGRTRLQGSLADLGNGHATAQEAHA